MTREEMARWLKLCARSQGISDCRESGCPLCEDWYRNGCERELMAMAAEEMEDGSANEE